jgi:hypothetical protein
MNVGRIADYGQLLGMLDRKTAQEQRVHNAKDRSVCANTQREGKHGNDGEGGRFDQHANAKAEILEDGV